MNNNEFINKYTSGKCLSFLDFQVVAKKYGIYFEKINNDINLKWQKLYSNYFITIQKYIKMKTMFDIWKIFYQNNT